MLNTYHIVIDGLSDSVTILLPFIIIAFNASEKEAGIIIALMSMVNTFAVLSTVYLSRQLGFLRSLGLIILIQGICFFANSFSQNIYMVGFLFVVGSIGFSIFHNLAFSYLSSSSDKQTLGRTMGNFTAIGDIGRIPLASLAGFVAALTLAEISGWRIVCSIYGLGAIIFAGYLFIASLGESKEINRENRINEKKKWQLPSFSMLRDYRYGLPMSASILDAICSDQIFVFLPFLILAKGKDPKIISAFALVFTFGCFLGKAVLGRMVDRFGNRKVFVVSEVIMAILIAILLLSKEMAIVIGTSLVLGIVTKGTVPVALTMIAEPAHEKPEYDAIFAINSFLRGITHIVTPLLFGLIASAASVAWIFGIMAIAALGAVIPVLMMDNVQTGRAVRSV